MFLTHWGTEKYGEWLILSTIPAYLALTDVGISSAATNEMCILAARGDWHEVSKLFRAVRVVAGLTAACLILLMATVLIVLGRDAIITMTSTSYEIVCSTLLLSMLHIGLMQLNGTLMGGYRCVGLFAASVAANNISRLGEGLLSLGAVLLGGDMSAVVFSTVVVRSITVIVLWNRLKGRHPVLFASDRSDLRRTLAKIWKPAITYFGFPLSAAINNQGILLLVGAASGHQQLVVFSTVRTLTRTLAQGLELLKSAVWPQVSFAFGRRNYSEVRRLHRMISEFSLLGTASASLLLFFTASPILSIWTAGLISIDKLTLVCFLIQMFTYALWFPSTVVTQATNTHQRSAAILILGSLGSLAGTAFLLPDAGLMAVPISMTIIDIAMAYLIVSNALHNSEDTPTDYLTSVLYFREARAVIRLLRAKIDKTRLT